MSTFVICTGTRSRHLLDFILESSARRSLRGGGDSTTDTFKCSGLSWNSLGSCAGMSVIIAFVYVNMQPEYILTKKYSQIKLIFVAASMQKKKMGHLGDSQINDDNINQNATMKMIRASFVFICKTRHEKMRTHFSQRKTCFQQDACRPYCL